MKRKMQNQDAPRTAGEAPCGAAAVAVAPRTLVGEFGEEFDRVLGFAVDNIDAAQKSLSIFSRSMQALNNAWVGAACMTMDDNKAAAKALTGCRSASHWIELQSELTRLNAGRVMIRAMWLSAMSVQMTEEVLFPLSRRMNAALSLMTRIHAW